MEAEVKAKRAPAGAVLPSPIDCSRLFDLDIDDSIWEDIGLENDDDDKELPAWLSSDDMRSAIKAHLGLDRCLEEELRLRHELSALQEWFREEWFCLKSLLDCMS